MAGELGGLNGWQRLFVLLSIATVAMLVFVMASAWPKTPKDGIYPIYDCGFVDIAVSQERAKRYFRSGKIPSEDRHSWETEPAGDDCIKELKVIADGTMRDRELGEFWSFAWKAVGSTWLFLTGVYWLGVLLGWVWRGFFPRKAIPPCPSCAKVGKGL